MVQGRKILYGKLLRDRIPEIMSAGGGIAEIRMLGLDDVLAALIAKLHEEAEELGFAGPAEVPGKLADVYEILAALTAALGFAERSPRCMIHVLPRPFANELNLAAR